MPEIQRTSTGDIEIATESATPKDGLDAKEMERQQKILARARKQFKSAASSTDHFRTQAKDDTKFRAGTWGKKSFQWPEQIQREREADGRVCLTINRMPGFIGLVTNQARDANLRIRVNPVDNNGDREIAEILQGIIRNIEAQSFAEMAYAKGSDKQAEIGLGYIHLTIEWAEPNNPKSMRRRIRIKQVKRPLSVYTDAAADEPDWRDANFQFYVVDVDKETYMDIRGIDDPDQVPTAASLEAFEGNNEQTGDWFPNGKIRIAHYFNREPDGKRQRIAELTNGDIVPYPSPEELEQMRVTSGNPSLGIKQGRWVTPTKMVWRKIDALNVLEESVWPAEGVPFIPILGDELEVEGEKDYRGIVRDAKGSAMTYNVETTQLVEQVSLGTKAPVVGYRGQFGKPGDALRQAWTDAHRKPLSFLEVEPMDIDGKPAPFPQPVSFEPPIQGTIAAIHQSDEDLKSTARFRDASLAERGPQESGKAIALRQQQDILSNSHYLWNLRFALAAAGRQLIQLIRVVIDVPTVVRIMGNDEQEKKVVVFTGKKNDPRNSEYLETHPGPDPLHIKDKDGNVTHQVMPGQKIPYQLPEGVAGIYDLGVGEYDVETNASKDNGTRRMEELGLAGDVLKSLPPPIAVKFLDLYFMLFDSPVGRQMESRAKVLFPPPDENQGKPDPAQMQQQMQMMQDQFKQLAGALQAAQQELQSEREKIAAQMQMNREKLASQEHIAGMKLTGEQALIQAEMDHKERMTALEGRLDAIAQRLEHVHQFSMKGIDHAAASASAVLDQHNRDTDRVIADDNREQDRADAAAADIAGGEGEA